MIDKLTPIRCFDDRGNVLTESAPDGWELMEKINEIIDYFCFPPYATGAKGHPDPAGEPICESEDERIINAIIGILKNSNAIDINVSQDRMLAYLEKQKESLHIQETCKESANFFTNESEDDDWKRKELIQYLNEKGDYRTTWMTWLESLRPQPKVEWSEEDESRLDHAITTLAENVKRGSAREDFEFLASLPRRFNLQPKQEWSVEDEK